MTAVEVVALPDGDVHEMLTVFVGPWVIGGVLVSEQAIVPSRDATSIW
jgi:hypothetical protein